jgi:predicted dinucleotide-utilizing enzyme
MRKPERVALIGYGAVAQAALACPMNANVAAAVALAGAGFEKTTIELVADPAAGGNRNQIVAALRGLSSRCPRC